MTSMGFLRALGTFTRAGVVFACLATGGSAFAAGSAVPSTSPAQDPISIYTSDAVAMAPGGAADSLVARAQAQGQVRVIVMLRLVMRMEHTLAGREVVRQRAALHSVQDAVATRVLGSSSDQGFVRFDVIPAMSLFVNATQLRKLLVDPQVVSINEDIPMRQEATNNLAIIHADDVFAKGTNGTGYVVAVLDDGVANHPAFTRGGVRNTKVVSEACYNTINAAAGLSSLCPNHQSADTRPGAGVNCPVALDCGHGSHVASIAAGNSSTYDGVARDANVIAVMVFSRQANCAPDPSPCAETSQTDEIRGLQRIYQLRNTFKIAAVNISIGGALRAANCDAENAAFTTILNNLRVAGIAPVKSAGNSGSPNSVSYPGCISSTVTVGSSTANDLLSDFSNRSPLVDLIAPGQDINGAFPGNKYEVLSGTSMAAPHVAGSFALLKSAKPAATIADILAALKCSGKPIDRRNVAGFPEVTPVLPRIDLLGAFNFLKKPPNVLRTWTFTTADDAKDWQPLRAAWTTSGGFYVQSPLATGWVATAVSNCNSKLQVIARMRRVDPSPGPSYYNSGIYIKSQLDYGAETVSGYQFNFNSLPYCLISPPPNPCPTDKKKRGEGNVWRITQQNLDTGNWVTGAKLCQKNVEVVVNGVNVIRVDSVGASHSYYLNGKLICTFNDATFAVGAVTVSAFNPTPATGHSLAVDSLQIKSLDTAPVSENSVMDATSFVEKPSDGSTPAFALAHNTGG